MFRSTVMGVRYLWLVAIIVVGGCATYAILYMDASYGPEQVREHALCQLKMESFAGLDRGARKELVYHSARLLAAPPTRLGIDAQTTGRGALRGLRRY